MARQTRFTRREEELPVWIRDAKELGPRLEKLRRGIDYIERAGKYAFTEKVFSELSDEAIQHVVPTPALPQLTALSKFGRPPVSESPLQRALIVFQIVGNPRILIARSPTYGVLNHHVWVGDSANFVPGMPLNAIPHPQEPAFWKLVGAPPKEKGRW